MASSSTYSFAPENAELVDESFERCGIDPATLTGRHLRSARMSLGLMFTEWEGENIRLFQVDEQTQTLTDGDPDYSVATGTLTILDGIIRRSSVDTPVHRISREQYHLIPNKTQEGLPSCVYHDRGAGTYTLWNVPENSTDVFRYNRVRMIQDVGTAAQTPDLQRIWWEALCAGLAAKLSLKFAYDRLDKLTALAGQAFATAKLNDGERTDTEFTMGGL